MDTAITPCPPPIPYTFSAWILEYLPPRFHRRPMDFSMDGIVTLSSWIAGLVALLTLIFELGTGDTFPQSFNIP